MVRLGYAAIAAILISTNAAADQVFYEHQGWTIRGSKSGPIATIQSAINKAFADCGSDQRIVVDGLFGNGTKAAIKSLSSCETIDAALPEGSAARNGAVTKALWSAIATGAPAPNISERAASLKLTFEATDYPVMQWNFCQNRPFYDPANGQPICFSNDRRSFITWGPNGATAGHGREVQAIINQYLNKTGDTGRAIFNNIFGAEASAVLRMGELDNTNNNSPLETYLCGVWMDKDRRNAWRTGFKAFGANETVRETYKEVYRSASFDGGKINTFYNAWTSEEFGLTVTEIDHGFFVDRAAHMSISPEKVRAALSSLKAEAGDDWPLSAAAVRRHVALNFRPPNQRKDRLGRDIAFYIDDIGEDALSEEERIAWRDRGKRNVAAVGLSDERAAPAYAPGPAIGNPMPEGLITDEEGALCPEPVLKPVKP